MWCAENRELMGVSRVSMTFQWISPGDFKQLRPLPSLPGILIQMTEISQGWSKPLSSIVEPTNLAISSSNMNTWTRRAEVDMASKVTRTKKKHKCSFQWGIICLLFRGSPLSSRYTGQNISKPNQEMTHSNPSSSLNHHHIYILYIYTSLYIHILSYTVIASTKTKQTNTVQYCWINIGLSCLSRIIRVKDGQRVKAISPRSQPGDVGSLATWPSPCANALHGETCEVRWDRMGCKGHERGVVSIFEEVKSGETLSIGFVAWFSLPFPLCSKKWSNLKQH